MGIRYLHALSTDFEINRLRAISLILFVTGVPALTWLFQFTIAIYVLTRSIRNDYCPAEAAQIQSIVEIFFEICIEIQAIFILFFINYMAKGL